VLDYNISVTSKAVFKDIVIKLQVNVKNPIINKWGKVIVSRESGKIEFYSSSFSL
jgi:hypothetical protein